MGLLHEAADREATSLQKTRNRGSAVFNGE